MHKARVIVNLALFAVIVLLTFTEIAQPALPQKQPAAARAAVRLAIPPGEIARWRSPNLGEIRTLYARINGQPVDYVLKPRTNRCVAYIYGSGTVVRLTDCVKGRRVPYLRVRAVTGALEPVRLTLRLN